jgi:hypothetical protein
MLLAAIWPLGATAQPVDLLINGNFDSGPGAPWIEVAPWPLIVETASDPIRPVVPDSGMYAAWLGGAVDAQDRLYQDVAVPVGVTSLTLKGKIQTYAEPSGFADTLTVVLRYASTDAVFQTLAIWGGGEALSGWLSFFPIPVNSPELLAGQTVRISFESQNNSSFPTSFFLDTLRFEATVTAAVPALSGRGLGGLSLALVVSALVVSRQRLRAHRATRRLTASKTCPETGVSPGPGQVHGADG